MSRIFIAAFMIMVIAVPVSAGEAVTYEKDIKGIIAKGCIACHGSNAPAMEEFKRDQEGYKKKMMGPRADTYGNLMVNGSAAGALMRRLDDGKNTKDGKPGNMHVYLGSADAGRSANLETFKKWVGNWTLKRSKELSQGEPEEIKAPEK
jgi:mono/diheme cytochrome c family protein